MYNRLFKESVPMFKKNASFSCGESYKSCRLLLVQTLSPGVCPHVQEKRKFFLRRKLQKLPVSISSNAFTRGLSPCSRKTQVFLVAKVTKVAGFYWFKRFRPGSVPSCTSGSAWLNKFASKKMPLTILDIHTIIS